MHMVKHDFNQKVYELRDKKVALVKKYEELKEALRSVHKEIDVKLRKFAPPTPQFDDLLEFPEKDTTVS